MTCSTIIFILSEICTGFTLQVQYIVFSRWALFLNLNLRCLSNGSTYLSLLGAASQTPKDEGRGPGQPGEILGLKRPYDAMEGGISRGLPTRDSLSATNCEGKRHLH